MPLITGIWITHAWCLWGGLVITWLAVNAALTILACRLIGQGLRLLLKGGK